MKTRDYIFHTPPSKSQRTFRAVGRVLRRVALFVQDGGAMERQIEARKAEF